MVAIIIKPDKVYKEIAVNGGGTNMVNCNEEYDKSSSSTNRAYPFVNLVSLAN